MKKTICVTTDKIKVPQGEFRELNLESTGYTDSDGKKYSSRDRKFMYSNLVHVPYYDYQQIIEACPEGYRYSMLEETIFLAQEEERLKREGKSVKEALKHPLFSELNCVVKMMTHYAIRGIDGKEIGHYIERDSKGRPYARIDLFSDEISSSFEKMGSHSLQKEDCEKLVAEGIKFPVNSLKYNGNGLPIIEWNPVLGIPAVLDYNDDHNCTSKEPHTMHLWLDIFKKEVAVRLMQTFSHLGTECFDFYAQDDRSMPRTKYITSDVYVRLIEDSKN